MSDLYFDEESYYFEENKCGNEVFASPFFINFRLSLNIKKTCGNGSHEKETKPIHASGADLLHIRIGILIRAQEKHLAMHLLWASARLLVTRVSLRR